MASREKKEAIQNGIFGTIAGLVMGGIPGAIMAGTFSAATIYSEGKLDEELIQREKDRTYYNRKRLDESAKKAHEKAAKDTNYINKAKELINTKCCILMEEKATITYDYRRNHNNKNLCNIDVKFRPYVIVSLYTRKYGWIHDETPEVYNGKIYTPFHFYKKIKQDINDKNIKIYDLKSKKINTGNGTKTVRYMYTVDDKNFIILW